MTDILVKHSNIIFFFLFCEWHIGSKIRKPSSKQPLVSLYLHHRIIMQHFTIHMNKLVINKTYECHFFYFQQLAAQIPVRDRTPWSDAQRILPWWCAIRVRRLSSWPVISRGNGWAMEAIVLTVSTSHPRGVSIWWYRVASIGIPNINLLIIVGESEKKSCKNVCPPNGTHHYWKFFILKSDTVSFFIVQKHEQSLRPMYLHETQFITPMKAS